jgi:hypothetical protein
VETGAKTAVDSNNATPPILLGSLMVWSLLVIVRPPPNLLRATSRVKREIRSAPAPVAAGSGWLLS